MNYLPMSSYRYAWFYAHQDMPVPAEQLELIRPLTQERAETLWRQHISADLHDPESFAKKDWPAQAKHWQDEGEWQAQWELDDPALPEAMAAFFQWEDSTVVYFCYSPEHIVETRWDVFRAHWKNFLFLDDGPLLLGKKRHEVAQFNQNGSFRLGKRP